MDWAFSYRYCCAIYVAVCKFSFGINWWIDWFTVQHVRSSYDQYFRQCVRPMNAQSNAPNHRLYYSRAKNRPASELYEMPPVMWCDVKHRRVDTMLVTNQQSLDSHCQRSSMLVWLVQLKCDIGSIHIHVLALWCRRYQWSHQVLRFSVPAAPRDRIYFNMSFRVAASTFPCEKGFPIEASMSCVKSTEQNSR